MPPPSPSTHSFVVADRSAQGASYKGLAIASTASRGVSLGSGVSPGCELRLDRDSHLLEILSRVRVVPSVTSTETFVYLKLRKQTYGWGTK